MSEQDSGQPDAGGSSDDIRSLATDLIELLNPFEIYQLVGHLLLPMQVVRDVAISHIKVQIDGRDMVCVCWDDTESRLCDSIVNILRASLCGNEPESESESTPNPSKQ